MQPEEALQLAFDATQQVLAVCDGSHRDFVQALRLIHRALASLGETAPAIVAAQRAAVAAERLCGLDAPEAAAAYGELASALARGGDVIGASSAWERALVLTQLVAGDPSNPAVTEMLYRSARDALSCGHASWAQAACRAALAVRPPDVDAYAAVPVLELLAKAEATVGQFKTAAETQDKAAAMLEALVDDKEDPTVLRARLDARLHRSRGVAVMRFLRERQEQ